MDIKSILERIEKYTLLAAKSVLTVKDLSLLIGISEDRIRHLVCGREIPYYKQGTKVYFKKSEIEDWQLAKRIPTAAELKTLAATRSAITPSR